MWTCWSKTPKLSKKTEGCWSHPRSYHDPENMNADIHTAYQGCPGTGKTTTLMDVLADEIDGGTAVEDIAASTFRRSMAAEFKERATEKVGDIPDQNYFGTTHSLCYHLIGTPDVISEAEKAEFCERMGLTYTGPETGVESDVGSVVLDDNIGNIMFSSREYCINTETDPDKAMRQGNLDVSQRVAVDRAPVGGFEEFNAEYERFKDERDVVDFHDMFLLVLDQGLVPSVDVLIEDEFQDKTPLQVSVFEMWADEIDRVYVAGDIFQCIPEGEKVDTPNGPKPVEDVSEGDELLSAHGSGGIRPAEVTDTHTRTHEGDVIKFTTASGKEFSCTPEHELFARLPTEFGPDMHFVYVMRSDRGDYRVGKTAEPEARFEREPGATAMMVIEAYEEEQDALMEEKKISLQYGLPTDTFYARGDADGQPGMSQSRINSLWDSLDTESSFKELCADKNLSPDKWHIVAQGTRSKGMKLSRGGSRVSVGLVKGWRADREHAKNTLRISTSDQHAIEALREIPELNESDAKAGVRFRKQSQDYRKMRELAFEARDALRAAGVASEVDEKASIGFLSSDRPVPIDVVNASQVVEGMRVPVRAGGEARYEVVVDRQVEKRKTRVYDFTVPPMHNYSVGGVFVHNCIQGWAGAKPEHMIGALEQADQAVTLDTSYRFGPDLWNYATDILERGYNESDIEIPDIEPVGESTVERLSFSEYRNEVKRRKDEQSLHLLRAGYMSDEPAAALKSAGVPFSSPRGARWTDKMVDTYNGIVRVTNAASAGGHDFGGLTAKVDLSGLGLEEAHRAAEALRASNLRGTKKSTVSTLEDALDEESDTSRGDLNMLKMFSPGDIADNMDGQNPFGSTLLTKSTSGLDRMEMAYNELDGGLITEVNHEVRTIHAAKGKEAKNVYLFDGISPAVDEEHDGFAHRSKAEARVFFVGATRAIENLFVVDYTDKPKFNMPRV